MMNPDSYLHVSMPL